MKPMKHWVGRVWLGLLLVMGVAGGGCSSFRHDAKLARGAVVQPVGPEGLWVGRWHDGKRTSHGGELECVVTRTGSQLYRISTHSRWWRWFTSSLDVNVVMTPLGPGRFDVRGSGRSGRWGITGLMGGSTGRISWRPTRQVACVETSRFIARKGLDENCRVGWIGD